MRWVAKAKDLPPPQQKPIDGDFAVGCGKVFAVIGRGVQIGVHAIGIQAGDGFHGCVLTGEFARAAAIGSETGEQVGRNDDEALCGEFVGHFLGPVAKAEDLVNEDDHRSFRFDLGIDDEGLDGAIAVLESHVLVMAGRCIEAGFRPVLRVDGSGRQRKKHSCGGELKGIAAYANFMGRSLVTEEWRPQGLVVLSRAMSLLQR